MNIPGPPVVLNPEVIHLAKLVKIELDELQRRTMKQEARGDSFHARLDKLESPPTGGPPTGDPASQADSNTENPGRLVPIWVREYVEWKIDQRLGDKPPLTSRAGSEIPERGKYIDRLVHAVTHRVDPSIPKGKISARFFLTHDEYHALLDTPLPSRTQASEDEDEDSERWRLQGDLARSQQALQRAMGELDATNHHVKILEADRNAGIAACLRSCAQSIIENRMEGPYAARHLEAYADTVQAQPAGGPPTPDLADGPDSITGNEFFYRNTERQACIADIKAAFWGNEQITDRYDIAEFILDRIEKRTKNNA